MQAVTQIWNAGTPIGVFKGIRWLWRKSRPLTVGVVIVVAAVKVKNFIRKRQIRAKWANAGRDVVVLHCLGKGIHTPSLSPFVMKLATYLRLANIEYQVDFTEPFGPKGKSPWITINGQALGDSQLVMEFLGDHFQKDLSSHLSEDQKAIAWSFAIMIDEHLCWALRDWRWVIDWGRGIIQGSNAPRLIMTVVCFFSRRKQIEALKVQGMGRHTHQEISQFIIKDLKAISRFLGTKPFLMGEEPCEVDCSVFGSLVQIKYNYPGSPYTMMLDDDFGNLGTYIIRVKERLWPDWDQCLDKPIR